ncbi:cell division protein SepF [Candidatus Woesearchaeota archaeon]|nr:cell division protein SepF [Candidatus Woesearchaeota archaeon]
MVDFFSNVKAKITSMMGGREPEAIEEGGEKEYVELDTTGSEARGKVVVRPFVMETFEDIKQVVDALRDGNTIAIVNIRPLKDKDVIELKRAISKLKKTSDAISGDLAGFGDDYVIATPSFAQIYRARPGSAPVADAQQATQVAGQETF